MTLEEFIENLVVPNTLIRLWVKATGGHQMLRDGDTEVSMEWEALKGLSFMSKYRKDRVIGVTDIVYDGNYSEAVNIVIDTTGEVTYG